MSCKCSLWEANSVAQHWPCAVQCSISQNKTAPYTQLPLLSDLRTCCNIADNIQLNEQVTSEKSRLSTMGLPNGTHQFLFSSCMEKREWWKAQCIKSSLQEWNISSVSSGHPWRGRQESMILSFLHCMLILLFTYCVGGPADISQTKLPAFCLEWVARTQFTDSFACIMRCWLVLTSHTVARVVSRRTISLGGTSEN